MDDAQVWTLIGGFFAILIGSQTLMVRVLRSEANSVRAELREAITGAITPLVERIARLEAKVDVLDREVQGIATRWGRGEI